MNNWRKMPVFFDGQNLSEYLNVVNLNRGIGGSKNNNFTEVGRRRGGQILKTDYQVKTIEMEFSMSLDLLNKRRSLAKILDVDEPKKLIFGDEPDKYYLAIPDGGVDISESGIEARGTITWLLPDGLAYSNELDEFVSNTNEIEVENKGTYENYPILQATMKSENGFIGFINEDGKILQFGNPNEVDTISYQQSDKVIHEMMRNQGEWEINSPKALTVYHNYLSDPATPNIIEGGFQWGINGEEAKPTYPATNPNVWVGPLIYRDIPPNSNGSRTGDFEYRVRFKFNTDVLKVGRLQFHLQSDDGVVFATVIRDSTHTSNDLSFEIWGDNGKKFVDTKLNRKDFNGGFFEIIMKRNGDQLISTINQVGQLSGEIVTPSKSFTRTLTIDGIKDVEVTGMSQWSPIFGNYQRPYMTFTDTKFTWTNVNKWENIPNMFNEGDVLWVDTSSGEIYLNGVKTQLETLGNQWEGFKVKSGKSKIYCLASEWATIPEFKAFIRGAWV